MIHAGVWLGSMGTKRGKHLIWKVLGSQKYPLWIHPAHVCHYYFQKNHMLSIQTICIYTNIHIIYKKNIHHVKKKTSHFDHTSTMFHWTIFLARQLRADRHQASGEILYSRILSCCVNLAPNILGLVVLLFSTMSTIKQTSLPKHLAKKKVSFTINSYNSSLQQNKKNSPFLRPMDRAAANFCDRFFADDRLFHTNFPNQKLKSLCIFATKKGILWVLNQK